MKIAVEGCAHGELDKIYECIETLQEREGILVDLLICCGDFQAVRNSDDLRAMAVPEKYQHMCTFYKYYSGEKQAPILTIFIGGNHEASNYLQELPYGGWVAPNIYYLGRSGVIQFGGLRIGGLSGIFKGHDYTQGLWESVPYNKNSLRSVYHVRSLDVFRLTQLKDKVHVMLSHDWPRGITEYGNVNNLLKRKPFFEEDIKKNELGSAPATNLLHTMKPNYWFSAHLHCQFSALVPHEDGTETKFLALDKCLPKRRHLQILDIPQEFDGDMTLKYDAEWLAILKNTNHLLNVKNMDYHLPGPGGDERYDFTTTDEEKEVIKKVMGDMEIKEETFVQTAPIYQQDAPKRCPSEPIINPQTANLCEKLGIDDPVQVVMARSGRVMKKPQNLNTSTTNNKSDKMDKTSIAASGVACSPFKMKMVLPTPSTPIVNDNEDISDTQENSFLSPDNPSLLSNSTCSTTLECSTPVSSTPKKSFKRRNLAMYTPDEDVSVSNTSNSLLGSECPKSNKLPHMGNVQ